MQHGATQAFLHLLVQTNKVASPVDDVLYAIHQVLHKLGLKDKKFGTKARLCQALTVTQYLLNYQLTQLKKQKHLLDLLPVLKLYCNNRE